jgi:hypothetical protein
MDIYKSLYLLLLELLRTVTIDITADPDRLKRAGINELLALVVQVADRVVDMANAQEGEEETGTELKVPSRSPQA